MAQPAILFQLDEFGRFLKTLGEERHSHLYGIPSTLLKLYSSAGSTFSGKAYADTKKNQSVHQPCVVLYATTVPDSFWRSLSAESLSDGFLARLLVFESDTLPAENEIDEQPIPADILATAVRWLEMKPGAGNLSSSHPEPCVLDTSDEAKAIVREYGQCIDAMYAAPANRKFQAILSRAKENAHKLAIIYAVSESITCPIIDAPAMRWACELTDYLVRRLIGLATDRISESTFDANQKRVLEVIREANGQITRTALVRAVRHLNRRALQETLDQLVEGRWIAIQAIATKGRTRSLIRII
jgi:hypothetical protein